MISGKQCFVKISECMVCGKEDINIMSEIQIKTVRIPVSFIYCPNVECKKVVLNSIPNVYLTQRGIFSSTIDTTNEVFVSRTGKPNLVGGFTPSYVRWSSSTDRLIVRVAENQLTKDVPLIKLFKDNNIPPIIVDFPKRFDINNIKSIKLGYVVPKFVDIMSS